MSSFISVFTLIIDLSDSSSEFNPSQLSREAFITTNVTGYTDPF